jgi:carbamoyl-phosphate synthase/aspartate carbamoyltransferase
MDKQDLYEMMKRADQMRRPLRHYPQKIVIQYGDLDAYSMRMFKAASIKLGCYTMTVNVQPESLEDNIQTLQFYGDALVLRHPSEDAIVRASSISRIPVIQGGIDYNSAQALTDLYTLVKELRFRGVELDTTERSILHVTFLGYSRSVQPFVKLLELFPKIEFHYAKKTEDIPETDVLYVSRRQGTEDYQIDRAYLQKTQPTMILMHPFPRSQELSTDVDTNPRSVYFHQVENGLYMRMAILDQVLSATCSPTLWEWFWIACAYIARWFS